MNDTPKPESQGHARLRSSIEWDEYFAANEQRLLDVPWDDGVEISQVERDAIASSIQGFQLGESSEGRHLLKCARRYSEVHGDPSYLPAIQRFIREEQRHARELGRFMGMAGIPRIKKTWPDTVFRLLRHRAGLELSIGVLVTAEIIAKVYYPALRNATSSSVLRRVCDQIIHDEAPHVEFQCERLAILRQRRGRVGLAITHGSHRFLFWGTCFVVWYKHGKAMRAGGMKFRDFWNRCWQEFHLARQLMDPRLYRGIAEQAVVSNP